MFYIYKIKDCNYIGSTKNLEKRLQTHILCCYLGIGNRSYNYPIYQYIRNNNINIELEVLETYNVNCTNKLQRLVEQYYIDKYNSINNGLNGQRAFTNIKKNDKIRKKIKNQTEEGKLYNKLNMRKYRKNNKDRLNARGREKVKCPICKKIMSRNWFYQHKKRYH